jgi:hypothetical protein
LSTTLPQLAGVRVGRHWAVTTLLAGPIRQTGLARLGQISTSARDIGPHQTPAAEADRFNSAKLSGVSIED